MGSADGFSEDEFSVEMRESVELVCKLVVGVSGSATALVLTNGSGALASLLSGSVAAGSVVFGPLVAGAIFGVLAGRIVCSRLSEKFIQSTRAQLGGGQNLLEADRRILKQEVEQQLGMKIEDKEFDIGLTHAAVAIQKSAMTLS